MHTTSSLWRPVGSFVCCITSSTSLSSQYSTSLTVGPSVLKTNTSQILSPPNQVSWVTGNKVLEWPCSDNAPHGESEEGQLGMR